MSQRRRRWLPRVVALLGPIGVSLLLLGAIEAALRLEGFTAEISSGGDPKAYQARLFQAVTRDDGVRMLERQDLPISFRADKPGGGLRVFVIGESSVWGFPYGPELAFSRFLHDRLQTAWPNREIEIVNCGVAGIASWHTRRIVDEVVSYQPDVVIIYTGHNDWIVPGPEEVSTVALVAAQLRIYQLAVVASDALRRWRHGGVDMPRLNVPGEPYGYARDRARGRSTMTARERTWVATRYEDNLRAMVASAQAVGARVIIASLAQNLADFPPGASRHRPGVTLEQRTRWRAAVEEADRLARAGDCPAALVHLDEARRIDRRPALMHFARGRCLESLGRVANARVAYRLSNELDEVPLGAPPSFNETMRRVAADTGTEFVDVAAALQRRSPRGVVGSTFFFDHVHPSVAGHVAIASALALVLRAPADPGDIGPALRIMERPDVEHRVVFSKVPLYLVLGWYDAAVQEARQAALRYPDVQLEAAIAQLRASDPQREWSDLVAAPD